MQQQPERVKKRIVPTFVGPAAGVGVGAAPVPNLPPPPAAPAAAAAPAAPAAGGPVNYPQVKKRIVPTLVSAAPAAPKKKTPSPKKKNGRRVIYDTDDDESPQSRRRTTPSPRSSPSSSSSGRSLGSADSSDDSDDSDDDDDSDNDTVGSLGDFFDFDEEDDDDPDAVPDFGQDEFAREADRRMAEMQRRAGMNGRADFRMHEIPKDVERFFEQVKEDGHRQRRIKINFQEEIHHWKTSELRDVIRAWELNPKESIRDYDMNPLTAVVAYKYMRTILKEREKAKREDPDATEEDLRVKAKVHDAENYTNKVRDIKQKQLEQVRKAAKKIPAVQKGIQQAQKQNAREPDDVLCTGVVLKRYQCGPAYHLLHNPEQHGIACFFKPGYGKTLTAVALATLLLSRGIVNKIVAITPKSLRVNIKTEFQKCGSPNALEALRKMKVYTYESMDKEHETLPVDKHTLLICDEAHRLRESNTKVFKAVEKIAKKCGKVLAITATPFVNRTNDIVNLLHVLDPERIPVKNIKSSPVSTQQLKAYAQNLVAFPDEDISGLFAERRDMLVPCLLDDVQIAELLKYDKKLGLIKGPGRGRPKKGGVTVGAGATTVGAGAGAGGIVAPVFNEFLQNLEIPIEGGAGGESGKSGAGKNAYLVQTRQLSLGIYKEDGDKVVASTKILNMFANLENRENLPALVFTAFIAKGVDYILKVAKQVFKDAKLRIGVITGKIKESERDATVQRLNRGELDVVILSDAGSEGLNFRGVRSVHLLNMEWNPSITEQQVGRALRINAHRDLPPNQRVVNVYKYLSSIPDGLTMFQGKPIHEQSSVFTERRLYQIQMRKQKEQQDAMQALMEVAIQHNCGGGGGGAANEEGTASSTASSKKTTASPISVSSGSSASASGSSASPRDRLNTAIGMCEASHFDEGTMYRNGPYGLDYMVQLRGFGPGRTKVWEPYDEDESKGDI